MAFKFKLLTGSDPSAQYAAIATKDPETFYLLGNGIGYFGVTPLFGGGTQQTVVMTSGTLTNPVAGKLYVLDGISYSTDTLTGLYFYNGTTMVSFSDEVIADYIAKITTKVMTGVGYTGDDATVASTKAIVDFVNNKLNDSSLINSAFFRTVTSHTLTAADLADANISKPAGVVEGEVGLLFTADTDATAGGESYYFVSLKGYIDVYTSSDTDTIQLTKDGSNNFTANLKIKTGEASVLVDTTNGGIYLDKTTSINETTPSADKLVTEAALVSYINNSVLTAVTQAINEAMADVVTYSVDTGA